MSDCDLREALLADIVATVEAMPIIHGRTFVEYNDRYCHMRLVISNGNFFSTIVHRDPEDLIGEICYSLLESVLREKFPERFEWTTRRIVTHVDQIGDLCEAPIMYNVEWTQRHSSASSTCRIQEICIKGSYFHQFCSTGAETHVEFSEHWILPENVEAMMQNDHIMRLIQCDLMTKETLYNHFAVSD